MCYFPFFSSSFMRKNEKSTKKGLFEDYCTSQITCDRDRQFWIFSVSTYIWSHTVYMNLRNKMEIPSIATILLINSKLTRF